MISADSKRLTPVLGSVLCIERTLPHERAKQEKKISPRTDTHNAPNHPPAYTNSNAPSTNGTRKAPAFCFSSLRLADPRAHDFWRCGSSSAFSSSLTRRQKGLASYPQKTSGLAAL